MEVIYPGKVVTIFAHFCQQAVLLLMHLMEHCACHYLCPLRYVLVSMSNISEKLLPQFLNTDVCLLFRPPHCILFENFVQSRWEFLELDRMFSLGIAEVLFVERRQEECFFAFLTRRGVWQIKHLKISTSGFGQVDMIRHFSSLYQ